MSSRKGIDQLNKGVANINLGSSEDGPWESVVRKQKNKAGAGSGAGAGTGTGTGVGRPWGQQNPAPKAWGQPDTARRLGMQNSNTLGNARNAPNTDMRRGGMRCPQPSVAPPSQHGRNWQAKTGSQALQKNVVVDDDDDDDKAEQEDDEDDVLSDDDDDDDELLSDDYDSDEGPRTHESRKQHRMLKSFFEILDKFNVQEINDPERQWHCPACQGGPGAIDWYKGIQPLMTHARTKGSIRVKLHREFAALLDEELRRRGTSVVPAGESFGQWEGLKQETKDHEIVWPPMAVIMNTLLEKDDNDKWLGMGNQELLDYFHGYAAVRARHSYGPRGHRGMSVLIFDCSAIGYVEAERLHKHFLGQGTGRAAWESNSRSLFYPGGKRQLYGFLARKDDIEEFNRHCQGKAKLKYDMRSYQEVVVTQMRQMSEDNQQLTWFKDRVAKEQRDKKLLEESFDIVSQKLRKTADENRIVIQRTKIQHEQNKEEMDFMDNFYKDKLQEIYDKIHQKEDNFEKLQQEGRQKVENANVGNLDTGDCRSRAEELTKLKECQEEEMVKYVAERDEIVRMHQAMKVELKKRYYEEELELEKKLDLAMTQLMEKYAPQPAQDAGSSANA